MPQIHTQTLPRRAPTNSVRRLIMAVSLSLARRRDRQLLARLDPHLLRDIGLSPTQTAAECAKPFWQS